MQASYYDNQPKITHNRSNTQWHNDHKSNNTPLAQTTSQSTSSSFRATWLTVSSPAMTVPAVDNAPSTDAERSLTLPQTTSARRSPAMSSVRYLSVARSPLIAYIVRQPRRPWKVTTWFYPSPVTRVRDYQTMEGRQSSVTSRCLVAIFRHRLSDQTPPGTATSPSIADCCGWPDVTTIIINSCKLNLCKHTVFNKNVFYVWHDSIYLNFVNFAG